MTTVPRSQSVDLFCANSQSYVFCWEIILGSRFLFLCVHAWMCTALSVVPSCFLLHGVRVFHWPGISLSRLGWLTSEPSDLAVCASQELGFQAVSHTCLFFTGCWWHSLRWWGWGSLVFIKGLGKERWKIFFSLSWNVFWILLFICNFFVFIVWKISKHFQVTFLLISSSFLSLSHQYWF